MGGTSSSFVAASQVRNCTVTNCDFSGYMADHAVYCSMKVENYNVYNCRIRDVVHTSSLFKVRDSKGLKRFNIIDVKAHNLNGYLADLTALESPQAELLFQGIRVTKDSGNQSIFYGFCLSDNANGKSGDSMNVRGVLFKNNQFDYGYGGNPLINSGSGKRIRVEEIRYENVKAKESNFGGGNVNRIIVDNCTFDDSGTHASILCIDSTADVKYALPLKAGGFESEKMSKFLDNGCEFAQFRQIEEKLDTLVYFAEPHKPWQRGTNENTNGLLRFFFPKGCDFRAVSQEALDSVVDLINSRPRKCLGWKTPKDVFTGVALA